MRSHLRRASSVELNYAFDLKIFFNRVLCLPSWRKSAYSSYFVWNNFVASFNSKCCFVFNISLSQFLLPGKIVSYFHFSLSFISHSIHDMWITLILIYVRLTDVRSYRQKSFPQREQFFSSALDIPLNEDIECPSICRRRLNGQKPFCAVNHISVKIIWIKSDYKFMNCCS